MNVHDDPDFAGPIGSKLRRPEKSDGRSKALVLHLVALCLLNLIVPLPLGWSATHEAGRVGMLLAIVLLLGLGCWLVSRFRKIGRALIVGGRIVAVSQLFPALQIFAGFFAVEVASHFEPESPRNVATLLGGFVATIIVGGLLITVALAVAIPILWLTSGRVLKTDP